MIDIHCHILPGIDDGAKTFDESVSMARVAAASGTTDIVATPHANQRYRFDPEVIELKVEMLRRAVGELVRVHVGCDFHLSATNIHDALENPTKYAINHRSYVLVEFSDLLIPPTSVEIFARMRDAGMIPIITHPERNQHLRADLEQIRSWVQDECLVQVTAQSFLGRFGKSAKEGADRLMSAGLVHFVASDAHDPENRKPDLSEAYGYVGETYGTAAAERLFIANPGAVLLGEAVDCSEPIQQKKKKWYHILGKRGPALAHTSQARDSIIHAQLVRRDYAHGAH